MGNLSEVGKSDILSEFQSFLLIKKLVPEKNVSFYAFWVNKYFNFARKKQINADKYQENALIEFIETLKADTHVFDWQVRQAHDAIRLYYFHFRGFNPDDLPTAKSAGFANDLLNEVQRMIRLKHYSYSTEKTYLQWIRRFLDYTRQTGERTTSAALQTEDCKDFLSHLALKEKVSSSTQNQAFNALLFLFRNVLCKEIGDLAQTVRAKRGQKLPVVFSTEEMKRLLSCLEGRDLLIASMLYGSGMRLMELARLRIKDVDLDMNTLTVRSGKGDKDRTTILPAVVRARLQAHLKDVKKLHENDLLQGHGDVHLPDALDRKYPKAGKEWAWQGPQNLPEPPWR